MAVTVTADTAAFNIAGLGDTTGESSTSTGLKFRFISAGPMSDGRIALVWTFDPTGGAPDQFFFGVFDPATGGISPVTMPARYDYVAQGAGGNFLAISAFGTTVETINAAGAVLGTTNIFTGLTFPSTPAIDSATALDNGGFGLGIRAVNGATTELGMIVVDAAGNRVASAVNVATVGNSFNPDPVVVKLANGNIAMAWSTGGTSGAGMKVQLFTGAGVAIGGAKDIYTGATGSTFGNVWRAGNLLLEPTHDGGFVLVRGVDFQVFNAAGEAASERGLQGGTTIEDVEWTRDGKLLLFAEGTSVNGHAVHIFAMNATGGPLPTLGSVATLQYKPKVDASFGSPTGLDHGGNAVVELPDGSFVAFSSAMYKPGAIYDGALLAQKLVYTTTDPDVGPPVTHPGGPGPDSLVGGGGNDNIVGAGGNDFLFSNAFNPDGTMQTPAGNDTLDGGDGDDGLFGGDGADTLRGGAGTDGMAGGGGNDIMEGGSGADYMFGGSFSPVDGSFLPNSGNDTMKGGDGDDGLWGFDGQDTIDGDAGNDVVFGGAGGDLIHGGADNDYILGEDGDDFINGGTGFDYLYGHAGADTFIFHKGDSADWALDFKASEGDKLLFVDFGFANFAAIPLVDLSTPDNPAVQLTFIENGNVDQFTIFGVTLAELSATNVLLA